MYVLLLIIFISLLALALLTTVVVRTYLQRVKPWGCGSEVSTPLQSFSFIIKKLPEQYFPKALLKAIRTICDNEQLTLSCEKKMNIYELDYQKAAEIQRCLLELAAILDFYQENGTVASSDNDLIQELLQEKMVQVEIDLLRSRVMQLYSKGDYVATARCCKKILLTCIQTPYAVLSDEELYSIKQTQEMCHAIACEQGKAAQEGWADRTSEATKFDQLPTEYRVNKHQQQ